MALKQAAAIPLAAISLVAVVSSQALQNPQFFPPRLKAAELPLLPGPNVTGGGQVLIEALVDRRGLVTSPNILRATPPYTQFVLDSIARWQFEPARDVDYKGLETTVEIPITVVAIYRPPILMNAPTVGDQPKDLMKPSGDVAVAMATAEPLYPPNVRDGGVVLYEIKLDEAGRVTDTRQVSSVGGFDSAARSALAQFQFRPGLFRARPVSTTTYVLFGFRPPVGLSPLPPMQPDKEPYKPNYPPPPAPKPGEKSFEPNFPPPPAPKPADDPYKANFPPPPPPK